MLFNSLQFAVFFLVVYGLYLNLGYKSQNRMLLIASYLFYGTWDWRFLLLIIFSTILDYSCGLFIHISENTSRKKLLLWLSVCGNLTILGFFKYYNFFISNLQTTLSYFNISVNIELLSVIVPVGISFYTFQTMSYSIDIYRGVVKPTKKFFDFALFVAFFPQLIAGPIERAKRLLPQILSPRKVTVTHFFDGFYLIFWGLFQKIVIADSLAKIVNPVFSGEGDASGIQVVIALYSFAFQILCDFAGYTNIARGLARCMGFHLMENFRAPYLSKNPVEFWQRWHISLSSWVRDYLFIPLGGYRSKGIKAGIIIMVTMFLMGLWHGASWSFTLWGIYHAVLLIGYRLLKPILKKLDRYNSGIYPNIIGAIKIVCFFHLMCLGCLFFRSESLGQVYQMLYAVLFNFADSNANVLWYFLYLFFFLSPLAINYQFQNNQVLLVRIFGGQSSARFYFYMFMFYMITAWGDFGATQFIYFQF